MKHCFKNPDLQELLVNLLQTAKIEYSTEKEQIVVTGRYEEAFDSLVDAVRDIRYGWWHSFRPLEKENYQKYIDYMRERNMDFEEEIFNDVRWILTMEANEHYGWGIEDFGDSNG
jgi:hypothetical protein